MAPVIIVMKIIIAVSILNVWLFGYAKKTRWRGGTALTLRDEFRQYGFPDWMMYLTGTVKVILALTLLASVWDPRLTQPSALGISLLMLGAVVAHIRINDPMIKSLPAATFLIFSTIILIFNQSNGS